MPTELKKETTEQKEAFHYYYEMGPNRSYSKVAMHFKKAIGTIENWGSNFGWQTRVSKLDSEARNKETERQLIEGEADYMQRNIKIAKLAIFKTVEALKEGKLKYSIKNLIELMELEHKLRTGYNQQVDINLNLGDLSQAQLKGKIDDILKSVDNLSKISKFNKKEDIEDADYIQIETNEGKGNESK